jgi:hypothetical protein
MPAASYAGGSYQYLAGQEKKRTRRIPSWVGLHKGRKYLTPSPSRFTLEYSQFHSEEFNFSIHRMEIGNSLPVSPDITGPDVGIYVAIERAQHYRKPELVTYVHLSRLLQVDGSTGWRLFAVGRLVYG